MRRCENTAEKETINQLNELIEEKSYILEEKKQKLEELHRKNTIMKEILKRNKKRKFLSQPKIKFPLIAACSDSQKAKVEFKNGKKKAYLDFVNFIAGDVDLLMNIDMASHSLDEIIGDEGIEEEYE